MSTLYIANTTRQIQQFTYTLLEQAGHRQQNIQMGGQIKLEGLSTPDIDAIVKHHARYGMVEVKEIDRTKPFIGLCYSVDREIPVSKIMVAMEHNQQVLTQEGVKLRQEAALATHKVIDDNVREEGLANVNRFESSVAEEEPSGGYPAGSTPVGDGTRIEQGSEETQTRPAPKGPSSKKK